MASLLASAAKDAVIRVRRNNPPDGNTYPWVATFKAMLPKLNLCDESNPFGLLVEQELHCYGLTRAKTLVAAKRARTELSAGPPKRGRGRPRTNGAHSGWMLGRDMYILEAYQRLRDQGKTHRGAIALCVGELKKQNHSWPVSETEVKRVLRRLHAPGWWTLIIPVWKDGKLCLGPGHFHTKKQDGGITFVAVPEPRPVAARKPATAHPLSFSKKNR